MTRVLSSLLTGWAWKNNEGQHVGASVRNFPTSAFVIAVILFMYVFVIGADYDATGFGIGLLDGLLLLLMLYSFKRAFM